MAIQRGPVAYTGTIGTLRNYKLRGVSGIVVSAKGGPTAEQIATLPSMLLTRQNNTEMKGVTLCTKLARQGMYSGFRAFYDSNVTGRLNDVLKRVQLHDVEGIRGQRGIFVSVYHTMFYYYFDINPNKPLRKVFHADLVSQHDVTYLIWTMTMSPYTSYRYFTFRGKETHVRLRQIVFTVPDVQCDPGTGIWSDISMLAAPVHVEATSDWIAKGDEAPVIAPLVITLPAFGMGSNPAAMLQVAVFEFAVYEGGNYTITDHFGCQLMDSVGLS